MSLTDAPRSHLDASAALGEPAWGEASVADYFALMKPKVMSLVVLTAMTGLVLAPGTINPAIAIIAVLCIAVGAGASGALNMWWDADIDARMARTATRPIPRGAVKPDEARDLGIGLSVGSVLVLGITVNAVAAALLALTIVYYVVFYTMWLKRRTAQNIVIGGAAGAFPPMIGWAAVTGTVPWESVLLFAIIFLWTPPHFWALALLRSSDYERVGVPMLPVVAGPNATRTQIFAYSCVLAPLAVVPSLIGLAGPGYLAISVALGVGFLAHAWDVYRLRDGAIASKACGRLFGFSIAYFYALFAVLLLEHWIIALAGWLR
jgi:heme o synthase